jgi:hypothetical protein
MKQQLYSKNLKQFLALLFLSILNLLGCSVLQVPSGTLVTPEISEKTFDIGFATQATKQLYLNESVDVGNNSLKLLENGSYQSSAIASGTTTSISFKNMALTSEPGGYRLQMQLFGQKRQKAKKGNFSMSIFGGTFSGTSKEESVKFVNENKKLIASTNNILVPVNMSSQIAGAVFGYRFSDKGLIGFQVYKQFYKYDATGTISDMTTGTAVETPNSKISNTDQDVGYGIPLCYFGETFSAEIIYNIVTFKEPIQNKSRTLIQNNWKLSWAFN